MQANSTRPGQAGNRNEAGIKELEGILRNTDKLDIMHRDLAKEVMSVFTIANKRFMDQVKKEDPMKYDVLDEYFADRTKQEKERADAAEARAESEKVRADSEKVRADSAETRLNEMAAQLNEALAEISRLKAAAN